MTKRQRPPKLNNYCTVIYKMVNQANIFYTFTERIEIMDAITLTEKETTIREKLIKSASEGKTIYYSELIDGGGASLVRSLGTILEKITRYDIANNQPILASIVVQKETGLPNEGFFELCDTLDIDAYLSDLQKECFEEWKEI